MRSGTVCGDAVRRMLGDIGECKIVEILALRPTLTEIEEAAVWARGDGDVLAKSGHPKIGVIAQIVDVLVTDEQEAEPT